MDEILNLIETVSEGFPTYSYNQLDVKTNKFKEKFLGISIIYFFKEFIGN